MRTITGLTPKHHELLTFIISYIATYEVPPSMDEMAMAIERSKGNVHAFLSRLKERGYVEWTSAARSLTVLKLPSTAVSEILATIPTEALRREIERRAS